MFSPLHYRLTLDGEVREQRAMLVAIGNTRAYGGGMRICPDADPFDGRLDVTIIHPVSRFKLLRLLPQMFSGGSPGTRAWSSCGSARSRWRGPVWSASATGR